MSRKKFIFLVNLFLILIISLTSGYYNSESSENEKNSLIDVKSYPECKKNYDFAKKKKYGCDISDYYRYLEDRDGSDSIRFIGKLNDMFGKFMDRSEFITPVRNILLSYNQYRTRELLLQVGEYQYFYGYNNKNYKSILKRRNITDKIERDFINLDNRDSSNETEIKSFAFSITKKLMGYEISEQPGFSKIKFKYENGTDLKDELHLNGITEYAFVLKDTGFIYSKYPFKKASNGTTYLDVSSQSLYFHKFGTTFYADIEIYRNDNLKKGDVTAKVSDDGNYLFVKLHDTQNDTSAYYFYNLTNVRDFKSKIVLNRLIGNFDAYYELYSTADDKAIVWTDKYNGSGRIVKVKIPSVNESLQDPQVFIKEEEDLYIQSIIPVGKEYLVLICNKNSEYFLKIYNKYNQKFIETAYVRPGIIEDGQGDTSNYNFFFSFKNIYTPKSIYDIDLKQIKNDTVHLVVVVGCLFAPQFEKLDTSNFVIKKEYYKSKDGKKIPMIMFHNGNLKKNKKNPVIVEAYGDFTAAWHPQNSLAKMFFVKEFGGIWCIPGIRGIEGLGEKWTSDGRKLKRKKSFEDFIYGIKFLINNGYTKSSKIAIYGEGEGGLLTTVVSQQEPKLIGAVVAKSPLLDTIRYDKLTHNEYLLEKLYGDLDKSKYYKYLYSFSPYHQMDKSYTFKKQWPSTLIFHPLYDSVYGVQHTTKYLAKLYNLIKKNKKLRQANPIIASIMKHGGSLDKDRTGDIQMDELYRMLLFLQQVLDLKFEK
ncbi:Prolyl endopeptidase [Strongyloides ratti]|uniref:Prolyl endopeptidase n=1 Tax=Strongyloides ratti TaxID=34506 RepID=A0A090MPB8_STRRB|nr:Prolyl endopeptidase [Strongyloides ratti]CEF59947.1 Prolyl endopeptidase [Strongyloides ratti]